MGEQEFIDIVRCNEKVIYKVCSFYVSPKAPMEDLYQEVVVNLWRAWSRFRGESSPSTWIYRVALNTCISYIRKENKTGRNVPIFEMTELQADTEAESRIAVLYKMINNLNKIEKAVILLYLEDKSYQEIAEITGLTAGNVGVRLNRIKSKMKSKL